MTIDHCDVMWGALPAGISHSCVQFGRTYNAALLEQSQLSANSSWGTSPNYFSGSDAGDWGRIEWKLTPRDSRGTGNLRVTFYVDSGAANNCVMRRGWYHDPDLTEDTNSPVGAVSAGNTYVATSAGGITYQTGYFDLDPGFTSWNLSAHITKIEWQIGALGYLTIWEPGIDGTINHSCVRFG